jgi:hypothetical protein
VAIKKIEIPEDVELDSSPVDVEEVPVDDDIPMIVYREPYLDNINGQPVQMSKEHRVPISEWPAYAQDHGF